jgi:peroxiredoxin
MSVAVRRRLAAAMIGTALAGGALSSLAACSTGADAVDQTAGGDFRFVAGTDTGKAIPVAARKAAPDFSGQTLDGKTVSLRDYRGKTLVLNFWGSWCAPCRVEAPDLETVYKEDASRGLRVLGVDVKEADKQFATSFIRNKALTYPSLWDPDGRTALSFRNYPPNSIPSTIVIDGNGRVAAVHLGPLLAPDLRTIVDPILRQQQ